MQPILGYLYKQNITVVKNQDFLPYRENQLVYAKPLQIYKGIDNRFQFIVKNNDQKPVNLLDSSAVFNLIDPTTQELVFSRNLQIVYNINGTATTVIESTMLDTINAGMYNYSVQWISPEGEQQVVYSDDNYNAQGVAHISDAVYPKFVPSFKPTILAYRNDSDTNYLNVAFTDVTQIADRVKGRAVRQTIQYNCTGFTGTIECQATQDMVADVTPSNWFTIQTVTLTNFTGNDYFNIVGKFNAVKFKLTKTSGDVNYILYRP